MRNIWIKKMLPLYFFPWTRKDCEANFATLGNIQNKNLLLKGSQTKLIVEYVFYE